MKIKVSEATERQIDWLAAKCEGIAWESFKYALISDATDGLGHGYQYSTNWYKGGPIIEREKIRLVFRDLGAYSYWCAEAHEAYLGNRYIDGKGPTPLIAAMRCYIFSKLGDEVEIPEELL